MKRYIIYTIIYILCIFIFSLCSSGYFFYFYYTVEEGDQYYHSKVTENIIVFNYRKNIKKIEYCFTNDDSCDNYLSYDGDFSKKIFNVLIDYPDNQDGNRICLRIKTDNYTKTHCGESIYVVDSLKPSIKSLYDEIIVNDFNQNLENLFEVSSDSGINDFSCNYRYEKSCIECIAIGNNNLKSIYEKKIYNHVDYKLEGKKILFVGDEFTKSDLKYDRYYGFAGRIGLGNYMNWTNVGVSGATIVESNKSLTDQIKDNKEEKYDYIIMQGGINDSIENVSLGEISDGFERSDFDDKTFAGGLEKLFYYSKKYYPDAKLGFIITYKTPNLGNRDLQNDLIKKICNKWNVSYLDLYDGVVYDNGKIISYSEILRVDSFEYFYKNKKFEYNLNEFGYNVISKYISAWINTL